MSPIVRPVARHSTRPNSRTRGLSGQIRTPKDVQAELPLFAGPLAPPPSPQGPPRSRISARTLDDIARLMSNQDRELLLVVQALRLATGSQLRRMVPAPREASAESAARTVRRTLQRLGEWRVLDRLPTRIAGGRGGGSDSFAWFVGPAGRRLLGRMGFVGRRLGEPSDRHIRHTLKVAEIVVRLTEANRDDSLEILEWHAEPACWKPFLGPGGGSIVLKPDLAVRVGAGPVEELRYLVELDLATESPGTLEGKLRRHLAYRASGTELARNGVDPKVLWLVPDDRRVVLLTDLIARLPSRDAELFAVTTHADAIDFLVREARS